MFEPFGQVANRVVDRVALLRVGGGDLDFFVEHVNDPAPEVEPQDGWDGGNTDGVQPDAFTPVQTDEENQS